MRKLKKKKIRKQLQFFKINYGLQPPYKILVDGEFLHEAIEYKLYLKEQLPLIFQEKAFPIVTDCIIHELKKNSEKYSGTILMAKRLQREKCGHKEAKSSKECILSCLERNPHFCVASQNQELKNAVRQIPGIIIVFISYKQIFIEKTSEISKQYVMKILKEKELPTEKERNLLQIKEDNTIPQIKKEIGRKRAKGPNPLSCKKKKRKLNQISSFQSENEKPKEKKKRKRIRNRKKRNISNIEQNTNIEIKF